MAPEFCHIFATFALQPRVAPGGCNRARSYEDNCGRKGRGLEFFRDDFISARVMRDFNLVPHRPRKTAHRVRCVWMRRVAVWLLDSHRRDDSSKVGTTGDCRGSTRLGRSGPGRRGKGSNPRRPTSEFDSHAGNYTAQNVRRSKRAELSARRFGFDRRDRQSASIAHGVISRCLPKADRGRIEGCMRGH